MIIDLITNFFLNDLFGSLILGTIFLVIIMLAFLFFADSPKITIAIIPTILFFGLGAEGYIPQWVAFLSWIGMGLIWGLMFKRLMN